MFPDKYGLSIHKKECRVTPKLYTKKPVSVHCLELTPESFQNAIEWVGLDNLAGFDREECVIRIKTLEGVMEADKGDYIICGVRGEFYPCKADIFALTYTEATS